MTRIELGGVGLEVDVRGHGASVLLLHGFTGTHQVWSDLLPRFQAAHRRTIAPDLLGHGASDRPADPTRYALEHQAADLARLLVSLDAVPADVIGYSMGARLALRLAVDHPEVVRRLVVESPWAGIADDAERRDRHTADLQLAAKIEHEGLERFVDHWEAMELFATQRSMPLTIRERIRAERMSQDPGGLANAVRGAGPGSMQPLQERLAGIPCPTLVIAGDLDGVGLERARLVADRIPGARLEIIDGTGHAPHLEQPDTFARIVTAFLDEPT